MKMRILVPALGLLAALHATGTAQALENRQSYELPFSAGDSLIVQNDYGLVRIEPAATSDTVEVRVRTTAASAAGMANVSVVCQKVGTRIYVQAYFYRYSAESVTIEVLAPRALNVIIWGANPAVDLQNLGGFTRVETLTGFITAANLTGSTSLFTQNGDIEYTAAVQPQGDLRLETVQGNIRCLLQKDLSLRGWLRGSDRISWGDEVDSNGGTLERQLGSGGPLLLAASELGRVEVGFAQGPPTRIQHSGDRPLTGGTPADSQTGSDTAVRTESTEVPEPVAAGPSEPAPNSRPAAQGSVSSAGGDFSLKVHVDLVNVNASVRDRGSHRAVADLRAEDFEIYEDGRSQTITEFNNTEAPFSLLLLLDVSGSTQSYLSLVEQASVQFTRQIKPGDHIALATFNSRTRLQQPFTDDRTAIERAIRRIHSGGGTAFYDALSTCLTEYFQGVEGRKAVVVFTDGVDNRLTGDSANGSTITFSDLFREIKERDVLVYTIFLDTEGQMQGIPRSKTGSLGGILGDILLGRRGGMGGPGGGRGPVGIPGGNPQAYEQARQELEEIADQTGGRIYAPDSIQDLSGAYDEIANDLRVQYTLGYYSSNASSDGRWRKIDVAVPGHPDLVVRHRRGYYGGRN